MDSKSGWAIAKFAGAVLTVTLIVLCYATLRQPWRLVTLSPLDIRLDAFHGYLFFTHFGHGSMQNDRAASWYGSETFGATGGQFRQGRSVTIAFSFLVLAPPALLLPWFAEGAWNSLTALIWIRA